MATLNQWIAGARPRTLPIAIAPVAVGTGSAYTFERANTGFALLALVIALLLQIGVNFANDYSDGIRGTDDNRVGPVRLVGQGLATAVNVKLAAMACFVFAAVCGIALVGLSGKPLLLLAGIAAIWAAWHYTGGKHPYGYLGLGEVFVFVFFGLFATLGTTYTQADQIDLATIAGAVGVGAIACAILVANNLRDIPGDIESGKRTLAVRLGDRRTRAVYVGLAFVALAMVALAASVHTWAALGIIGLLALVRPLKVIVGGSTGKDLIPALSDTGLAILTYGLTFGIGLYLAYQFG